MSREILVIFETRERALWYIQDKILPLLPDTTRKNNYTFEHKGCNIRALSYRVEDLRGLRADFIFLSDDCSYKFYHEVIIGIVKGDHNKIQVVM